MSMANDVISYVEMCQREGMSLQRGMNYRVGDNHSVLLMSVRPNAPYNDRVEDDGATLIYEGHDVSRRATDKDPKAVDQPKRTSTGKLTQNGRFHQAAQEFKRGKRSPERVRVYEHIIPFSKGGTSLKAENIQLLCARHNFEKSDRIG